MRSILITALVVSMALTVSGCVAVQQARPIDPAPTVQTGPLPEKAGDNSSTPVPNQTQVQPSDSNETASAPHDIVPKAEVESLLAAAHSRPYTMTWEVSGNPDYKSPGNEVFYRTWGRTGVMPNGDRYVLLGADGFMHKGNQAWYLVSDKGRIISDPPETGGLKQRPGIQMWEGIQPDQLGVLDAIWRNSGAFERTKTGTDTEQWTSGIPSRRSSEELFRSYREVVEFWVTVRRIDKVYLPVRFHLTWWDAKLISFDGMYDWNPPTFPQVSQ